MMNTRKTAFLTVLMLTLTLFVSVGCSGGAGSSAGSIRTKTDPDAGGTGSTALQSFFAQMQTDDTADTDVTVPKNGATGSTAGNLTTDSLTTDSLTTDSHTTDTAVSEEEQTVVNPADFGYDFEEAKKFIGDWYGLADVAFSVDARKQRINYDERYSEKYGVPVYARIAIDENGNPLVYFRAEFPDIVNYSEIEAQFSKDGSLNLRGTFAQKEWYGVMRSPEEDDQLIDIQGIVDERGGKELFRLRLKPFGGTWTREDLPYGDNVDLSLLNENSTYARENNMSLEDMMRLFQNIFDYGDLPNSELEEAWQTHLLTDDIPDPELLFLYTEDGF